MTKQLSYIYTIIAVFLFASCGYRWPGGSGYDDPSALCRYVDYSQLSSEEKLSVPYESQDFNYCGPAALSMVLRYFGEKTDQHELGDGMVKDYGVTPWDIKKVAISYGFKASVVSCGFNNLLDLIDRLRLPVIVRVINSSGTNGHYIVVKGYDLEREVLYVNDPAEYSNREIPFDEFREMWDINGLEEEENSTDLMIVIKK
ncbi:MAG: C39 family peptidase [Oligoflexia bacterium]|nr:C39 family peptidase [Oligoflexia bacterium]